MVTFLRGGPDAWMAFAEDMATPEIAGLSAADVRAPAAYGRRFDEVKESPTMMLSMK
jgi:hypothetical protein